MDDLTQRLVAQLCAGTDAMIGGPQEEVGRLLAAATPLLEQDGEVIVATATEGELSLSALIAAISGQPDLGGQDDSVLELGFKRLTAPGRTVLVIEAPAGMSRSALRYVQHMGRLAPRLVLVVQQSAPLDFMLGEPGFAPIRDRLRAAPPLEPAPPARILRQPPPPVVPATMLVLSPRRPRRSAVWIAATVLGLAAAAGGALLVYGSPFASWGQERGLAVAAVPAIVPLPPVEHAAAPALAAAAPPPLFAAAPPAPVVHAAAPVATAGLPPLLSPATPTATASATLPPLLKPDRAMPSRHAEAPRGEPGRAARPRAGLPSSPGGEWARYAGEAPYPEPPPVWVVPEPRRRGMPYIGTYAVDPYGMRVFRYDP